MIPFNVGCIAPVGSLKVCPTRCPGEGRTAVATRTNTKATKSGIVNLPDLKLSTSIASQQPKAKSVATKQIQVGNALQMNSNGKRTPSK